MQEKLIVAGGRPLRGIKEATDSGALMHFTKPFDIDELRTAVNKYLELGDNKIAVGS